MEGKLKGRSREGVSLDCKALRVTYWIPRHPAMAVFRAALGSLSF
jgi:hypothetical protein